MPSSRVHPPRRSRLASLLGGLAALLTLIAWPATRVHEATTEHAVCAEHGEVIDLAAADAHGPPPEEGERWRARAEHGDEHEHCPFLVLGQAGAAAGEGRPASARLVEAARGKNPGSEVRLASVPLLCLAPKQSPPV